MVEGWLKLYRSIQNHWLWEDKPFSRGQAFVDLLLMANHKDNKILFNGELIEIKRGSRITSLSNTEVTQKKIKKNSKEIQKKTNKNDKEVYKNDKERKEGGEEEAPPTSPRFYPSPIHELLANSESLSPVSYKTFFENADIREEAGVIQIKPENEFSKGAIKKYIPTLEIETHKKIEVI